MQQTIKVKGARQHNLKNIDLEIPKNQLVVFTGVSGSGKSSMAFDTIYAEGQRRYVESLSTYARQFLGIMGKPDVDSIEGLSPAISIDQKTVSHNPRSTVGTVTEIYDYLRLFYARIGHPHCPVCGREISTQTVEQIVEKTFEMLEGIVKSEPVARAMLLAPLVKDRKGAYEALLENVRAKGYRTARIDGRFWDLSSEINLIKTNKHTIEAVVDRISITKAEIKDEVAIKNLKTRLADSVSQALALSDGLVVVSHIKDAGFEMPQNPKDFEDHLFSEKFSCPIDNIQLPEIEPRSFSFNSPHGACPECTGIGRVMAVNESALFSTSLSIKEGGIVPFSSIFEHDTWFSRLLIAVCEAHGIDPAAPIGSLTKENIDLLLKGTGDQVYVVVGNNKQNRQTTITEVFPGIVAELMRRYKETDSDYIRSSIEKYLVQKTCDVCLGARLKPEALSVTVDKKSISDIANMNIVESKSWFDHVLSGNLLNSREKEIGTLIAKEITTRLSFLADVGLSYLNLARGADTLSGGEAQRIRLASQIGSGLTGVLYVLDEPTIGLHPQDNDKLILTLKKLRELGNSVVVVEHDLDVMRNSDHIVDFGPKAGKNGGLIVGQGKPEDISKSETSVTGPFISGKKQIKIKQMPLQASLGNLTLKGARQFNLKNVNLSIPLSRFTSVTGLSGSGKSTLVVETLYHALNGKLTPGYTKQAGEYDSIEGFELVDKVILIDQSPIGRTPRSNPATYTKIFDLVRDVFAETRDAKVLGFKKGRFSFNVKGGRCESCEGQGQVKIEMQFMPDIWVDCEVCKGARYNQATLEVLYKGKTIADVLKMTVADAREFFHAYPNIVGKLETLSEVGLDYMELGQPATTLSGGEAQRVKLSTELARKSTGKTVYILDEPTTGLHFVDLEKLLVVLKTLVSRGNTVVVVEHNLDVVKNSDWVIDLGPGGGENGGQIVSEGTPQEIAKDKKSVTGTYLAKA